MSLPEHLQHAYPLIAQGLKPETAEETMAVVQSAMSQEFLRGMEEAASLLDTIASKVNQPVAKQYITNLAGDIRKLEAMNRLSDTKIISKQQRPGHFLRA